MRARSALVGLMIGLFSAGCSLVENGASILPGKVRESLEDCAEHHRNRRWADQAWEQVRRGKGDGRYSVDYGDGFKDGFADFLYAGGDGEPPPLPPNKYRALCYQTPRGFQATEDWFAGYRHGACVARDNGYRQWVTGPSSLQPTAPPPAPAAELLPVPASAKEEKQGAAPPPHPVHVAVEHREPAQPVRAEKKPRAAPVQAAPPDVQARFRRELNKWEIVWTRPDGSARTTMMSPGPFTEMIRRVMRENSDDQARAGRHGVTIDNGTSATAREIHDQAFDGVVAYLNGYYEDPGK